MRKIREVFDITFRCNREIERRKYSYKGLILIVQSLGRNGKIRIDIRGLTPERIGQAICGLEGQIMRDIDREKAREIIGRVMEILRKELTMEESTAMMHSYRQARLNNADQSSPVISIVSASKSRGLGQIINFIRPKNNDGK